MSYVIAALVVSSVALQCVGIRRQKLGQPPGRLYWIGLALGVVSMLAIGLRP